MKSSLITIGATHKRWAVQGEEEYRERLKHYLDFEIVTIPDLRNTRNMDVAMQKNAEGELILAKLQPGDFVILLDERGKEFTSKEFAVELQQFMNRGIRRAVFIIGGPYGFSQKVYDRADKLIAFSKMTFPHDLIRVVFMEQLYRACTILRNEKYHH